MIGGQFDLYLVTSRSFVDYFRLTSIVVFISALVIEAGVLASAVLLIYDELRQILNCM